MGSVSKTELLDRDLNLDIEKKTFTEVENDGDMPLDRKSSKGSKKTERSEKNST